MKIGTHRMKKIAELSQYHYKCEECGMVLYLEDDKMLMSHFNNSLEYLGKDPSLISCNEWIIRGIIE